MEQNKNQTNPYADIIDYPYDGVKRHPRMPLIDRAAQFGSFSPLAGHKEAFAQTARLSENNNQFDEIKG